ncbi:MAG: alpha/beta hydrolase [archaeon]
MKRIFLIHGWDGNPKNCWFPWLKQKLEEKGFQVIVPKMPNAEEPKINVWVPFLTELVKEVDEETYFVGHSIGCQTIMRFLETQTNKIGGIIFVAGFFNLPYLETEEEKIIAKEWIETPIDTEKIKSLTQNIIAIFSDNDEDVPLSDSKLFRERLNAKIIIEKEKGHFDDSANIKELPVVFNELLKMS